MSATITATAARPSRLKRIGVIGFWFFLIKGVLWMAAPAIFYYLF